VTAFWGSEEHVGSDQVDVLVAETLKTWVGEDNFPGDLTPSDNWPGVAPGTRGILNALSPKYCRWDEIVDLEPKPPVMWTHGSEDPVVSEQSIWDAGALGAAGAVPDWPGPDICPAQPMVTQTRDVLATYAQRGGLVHTEWLEGAHHFPLFEARDRWLSAFIEFLNAADHADHQ
jgi:pimeloyl-ACP methyl ester carboxylesterase